MIPPEGKFLVNLKSFMMEALEGEPAHYSVVRGQFSGTVFAHRSYEKWMKSHPDIGFHIDYRVTKVSVFIGTGTPIFCHIMRKNRGTSR